MKRDKNPKKTNKEGTVALSRDTMNRLQNYADARGIAYKFIADTAINEHLTKLEATNAN